MALCSGNTLSAKLFRHINLSHHNVLSWSQCRCKAVHKARLQPVSNRLAPAAALTAGPSAAARAPHRAKRTMPLPASDIPTASVAASGDDEQQQPCSSQSSVTVRALQASDKARWDELFRDYITWYKTVVPDDVVELCWQRLMEGGEGNHIGLVAEQEPGGLVVGLAHVLLHRSTWHATHYCYLEDLYVDTQVRAQGVGKALIEAVYRLADERKCAKVYWQTHENNYRARGLYDKMGGKSQFILYERK